MAGWPDAIPRDVNPETSKSRGKLPKEASFGTEKRDTVRPAVARKRSSGWKATAPKGDDPRESGVKVYRCRIEKLVDEHQILLFLDNMGTARQDMCLRYSTGCKNLPFLSYHEDKRFHRGILQRGALSPCSRQG